MPKEWYVLRVASGREEAIKEGAQRLAGGDPIIANSDALVPRLRVPALHDRLR